MKTIHIISHTHWDREWYLHSKYTNEWLVDFFEGLFAMLEKEPGYQFVLDGQTMLLEDYFGELRKKGMSVSDRKAKLQKHAQARRIFIGPLYNQPDWQLISEESLVKNLILGHQISQEYGDKMKIGWLLDNFGQISQTAQILHQAGLEGIYVWRGVEMDPQNVSSEFYWEAPNGTKLLSIYLLDSYRNGMRLAEYKDIFDIRMKSIYERLLPFASTENILVLNGYDQEIEPDDVLSVMRNGSRNTEDYALIQSNPEQYVKAVLEENPALQTLQGALYSGRFISVFPGILSARMYLKQQNHNSEKLVEKNVEPLATMNWLTGGEYNKNHIDAAYKKLLMNQPHDSICGCSIDDVHKDMEERSGLVDTLLNDELNSVLSHLASKINTTDSMGLLVFNTSPYKRNIIVENNADILTVPDVPAFGYKVVKAHEPLNDALLVNEEARTVENKHIKVTVNENGSVDVLDKHNNKLYAQQGLLQDKCDSGDEYNYSFPTHDTVLTTRDIAANIKIVQNADQLVRFKIAYDFDVPKTIIENRSKRSKETIKMPVTTYITVKSDSPVVEFETDILNTAKNHIVSALFETRIQARTSQAGAQFDVVTRDISYEDFDEAEIPTQVKEVIIGAREPKPNKIFPHREFVDISDGSAGLAVLNKGLPEFTVNEVNNVIELTLFRSVEWVADEINSRLGDAGPKIFTPDAQCLRQMKFSYALYPHQGDYDSGNVLRIADEYNTDPIIVETTEDPGSLPESMSCIALENADGNCKVTGMKRSLDEKAVTLRIYNSARSPSHCRVLSDMKISKITRTNLIEEEEAEIEESLTVNPKEIVTLKIYLERSIIENSVSRINKLDNTRREDYTEYPMEDYVTEEDILSEIERAKSMLHQMESPDMGRTALEAQLSAILTRIRKDEKEIRRLGYKLNHARVIRRVWDYIKKYKK